MNDQPLPGPMTAARLMELRCLPGSRVVLWLGILIEAARLHPAEVEPDRADQIDQLHATLLAHPTGQVLRRYLPEPRQGFWLLQHVDTGEVRALSAELVQRAGASDVRGSLLAAWYLAGVKLPPPPETR